MLNPFLAQRYKATLTDLLDELNSNPEAMTMFEEFYPHIWDDLAEQGYRCLELDQLPQAIRIFSFLLQYNPKNPAYSAGLADAHFGMKQYMEAANAYQVTATNAPDIPDAHFLLGEIWLFFRHGEQALQKFLLVQKLLKHQPDHYLHEQTMDYIERCTS